jgi:hypothetical protein
MRLIRRLSVALLALLTLAMAAIYLVPLDTYVPDVERVLGEQLHEPVSVRRLRLAALPLPHLELQEVRLGERDGITASSVEISPDLLDLLAGKVAIRRITVKDGTAHLEQLRKLVDLLGAMDATAQNVAVRELQLSGMNLLLPEMTLGPIEGRLNFAPAGELERAWFAMDEQKLTATLLPLPGGHFSLQSQAQDWTPSFSPRLQLKNMHLEGVLGEQDSFVGDARFSRVAVHASGGSRHPLVLDEISAHIVARPERLELSSLRARLYGGKLSGTANVNRKGAMLRAELSASDIALQSLVRAFTDDVLFTGSMEGAAKLSMSLDNLERFPGTLRLTGNFHLRHGVLTKVDLVQAASGAGKADARGGTTQFDDLTGLLRIDAGGYHFKDLKIVSGMLKANGKLDVSPSLQLDGALEANVKGTAGLVSMPMAVSGTLDEPVVRPSSAAMAGAAVGTAILGPGFGTAAGIRVGGFLDKLFGKDDDKKNNKEATSGAPAKK